jgi:hypothetical protein
MPQPTGRDFGMHFVEQNLMRLWIMLLDIQIAKKATVRSRVLIAKMDWWQKVIQLSFLFYFWQLNCKVICTAPFPFS